MNLLGVRDIAKRWGFTKQGVHQRRKKDFNFPDPVSIINDRILVFLEEDIIAYEKKYKPL